MSKAFLKSVKTILPSILYLFENSITSSMVLTASKMVLPFTYADGLKCMMFGKTFSNLLAMAFEPILTSTLMSEIGLQFEKSLLSLSFFSIRVIMASF